MDNMTTIANKLEKISDVKNELKDILAEAYGQSEVKTLKLDQFPAKFKAAFDERADLSIELSSKLTSLVEKIDCLEKENGIEYVLQFEDVTSRFQTTSKYLNWLGELGEDGGVATDFLAKEEANDMYVTGNSEPYGGPRIVAAYDNEKKIVRTPDGNPATYGINTKLFRFPLSEESMLKITGGNAYSYVRVGSYELKHFKLERASTAKRVQSKKNLDRYPRKKVKIDIPSNGMYLSHITKSKWTDQYPWNTTSDGYPISASGWKASDYIPVTRDSKFIVTSYAQWNTTTFNFYSFDKQALYVSGYEGFNVENANDAYYLKDYQLDLSAVIDTNPSCLSNVAYVRFSGNESSKNPLEVYELKLLDSGDATLDMSDRLVEIASSNCLFKKKYISIGDSFVSPAYSYANLIAGRNQMQFTNLGIGGTKIGYFTSNLDDSNAPSDINSVFSYRIDQLSNQLSGLEYATIQYGLNENSLSKEQIGEKTVDGELNRNRHTLWGAWNYVLEKLLTWNPSLKIGIVISDSWLTETQRTTQLEIGKYWGIPCLDMKGDPSIPLLIGQKTWDTCPIAKKIRTQAFAVDPSSDTHPNQIGHIYRSTIVENFLRSL